MHLCILLPLHILAALTCINKQRALDLKPHKIYGNFSDCNKTFNDAVIVASDQRT